MENSGFEDIELKTVEKVSIELYNDEKKHCPVKNAWLSQKVILVVVAVLLVLIFIFGGFYYMQQSNKKEIQKELRAVLAKLTAAKLNGRPPPLGHLYINKEIENEKNDIHPTDFISSVPTTTPTNPRSAAIQQTVPPGPHKPWLNMRLPKSIIPQVYHIDLKVDMETDDYNGSVTINVSVTQSTNIIIFHKVDLTVIEVSIEDNKNVTNIAIEKEFVYEPNEFYIVQTSTYLKCNDTYILKIKFKGKMRTDLNGFYTSFYTNGIKRGKVASTFFSPISARRAFPCFDEPLFKAIFTLTLTHSSKYHALSNMMADHTSIKDGMATRRFRKTLKMSTYLLCWVIGDYRKLSVNKTVSAWTYNQDVEDVRFTLENGIKLLKFYEEYFQIPYPLEKLDLVAVPSFGPGAMENWGIITFRAERILINKKTSTADDRQSSYYLVAHELVHQWFGNLVTMEFWTDAWLKEGFANNIGAIGGDHVNKDMGAKEHALLSFMLPALELDSYSSSHPISTSVKTPSDIRGMFNMITYNKGSCLVDLLHNYLGQEDFKKGLQRYLRTYAYRNANQDDLWEVLSTVSGKDVKKVMDTWTLQLGYPVISIRRINHTFVEVSQKRFTLDAPSTIPPPSPFGYIWKVPIIFKAPSDESTQMYLLEGKTAVINVTKKYSIVNPDHALFYRVNYSDNMLDSIKNTLKFEPTILTSKDRTGIIADQFSFVSANLSDIGKAMDLISYLKKETDYYPWQVALEQLSYVSSLIMSKSMKQKFDDFVHNLTIDLTRKIGWKQTKTMNEGALQELFLYYNCRSDKSFVYQEAKNYYMKWIMGQEVKLRPTLQTVMRDCAISVGPVDFWDFAYMKFKQNVGSNEYLLWSLCTTNQIPQVQRMLNYSLDNMKIDEQYTPYVISALAVHNHETRTLCWNFIKTNWSTFIKRYGTQVFMLSDMLSEVLEGFSTQEELNDIKTFFKNRHVGSAKQSIEQAVHKIEANILWKNNNFNNLRKWLEKQKS